MQVEKCLVVLLKDYINNILLALATLFLSHVTGSSDFDNSNIVNNIYKHVFAVTSKHAVVIRILISNFYRIK